MTHKRSNSGLGVIVILIGITILLLNFNILSINMFWGISKLWPLIFIVIGLSILLKSIKYMGIILWLVFIGIVIGYSFLNMNDKSWNIGSDAEHEKFEDIVTEFDSGVLNMNIKTGEINIVGGGDFNLGYEIPTAYTKPVIYTNDSGELKLAFEENNKDRFSFSKNKSYDIKLPTSGYWSLDIESGVGETNLNLEGVKVKDLQLDVGVGACQVSFGKETQGKSQIDIGVGEVVLNIPENIGVKVYVDKGVGSVKVPDDYKKENGNYTSANYKTAELILEIHVDVGVGSLKIK